jgi:hypothetical protein
MAPQRDDVVELLLDCALEATFPASDPVSISSAVLPKRAPSSSEEIEPCNEAHSRS